MANDRSEPSMEAILSSIKKIIADEDRSRAINSRKPTRDVRRSEHDEDVLELTEAAGDDREEELLDTGKARSPARGHGPPRLSRRDRHRRADAGQPA